MAKFTIVGTAAVITSSTTMEKLKAIKKLRPEKLTLKGGEDGKEPIFVVDVGDAGKGSIGTFGACFDGQTHEGGYATITIPNFVTDGVDPKKAAYDKYGAALVKLNKLEAALDGVFNEIEAEKATVMNAIAYAE